MTLCCYPSRDYEDTDSYPVPGIGSALLSLQGL